MTPNELKKKCEEESVEWTTGDGRKAVVIVSLVKERGMVADHKTKKPTCAVDILAKVNGTKVGSGRPVKVSHSVAVARIGDLALTKDNLTRVERAIRDVESCPYAVSWKEKASNADRQSKEYDSHRAKMRGIMGY